MPDDHTLEIEVSKEQSLNDIFARSHGSRHRGAVACATRSNRLEELFMRLVEQHGQRQQAAS